MEPSLILREAGVIDLGSNSVRLVIYRIDGRALTPILNEKVTAALGRGASETGVLSPEGKDAALQAVRRFASILKARGVKEVHAVATAAIRDARDGEAFARMLLSETGVRLRILSGQDEARLSALGVISGIPEAVGVVGDLGGSSLELVAVSEGVIGQGESLRLGHLALADSAGFSYERVAALADGLFAASQHAAGPRGGDLYVVGGAWRALGRIDMALNNHPLRVLHHHEMSRAEALKVADFVRRQSRRSLEKLEEAAAKRAESLPYAAVVLERLMLAGGFERLIISSSGLREGVLFSALNERRGPHPLLAAAEAFSGAHPASRAFGAALADWIEPAFAGRAPCLPGARDALMRAAAARLADLGSGLHPDQREAVMFDLVLRAPVVGVTHAERAYLAAAVHHRHAKATPEGAAYARLLNEEQRAAAAALGAALRLGAEISARSAPLLARSRIEAGEAELALTVAAKDAYLVSDAVRRRLDALCGLLGVSGRIGFA